MDINIEWVDWKEVPDETATELYSCIKELVPVIMESITWIDQTFPQVPRQVNIQLPVEIEEGSYYILGVSMDPDGDWLLAVGNLESPLDISGVVQIIGDEDNRSYITKEMFMEKAFGDEDLDSTQKTIEYFGNPRCPKCKTVTVVDMPEHRDSDGDIVSAIYKCPKCRYGFRANQIDHLDEEGVAVLNIIKIHY